MILPDGNFPPQETNAHSEWEPRINSSSIKVAPISFFYENSEDVFRKNGIENTQRYVSSLYYRSSRKYKLLHPVLEAAQNRSKEKENGVQGQLLTSKGCRHSTNFESITFGGTLSYLSGA